jgi:hypothetical protein
MTDAISRSAVLEAGNVRQVTEYDEAGYYMTYNAVPVGVIEALPALDVAPVVHARWIYTGEMDEDGNCEANCSHCGAGDKHRADLKDAVPCCWKCGAQMDGEAE